MKLLVTGGSSFLGSHILKRAPREANWQLAATYFSHPITEQNVAAFCVDMRDPDAVQRVVSDTQPNVIIHTPAVTPALHSTQRGASVTGELLNPLNVDGSRTIAHAAVEAHARLIHISSDVIFDGEHAPYGESAQPQPITPYAESKVQGEQAVREEDPSALIVRTSLLYGFNPMDARTRDTIEGKLPRLFTDEFRCPIFVNDLADALIEIASKIDFEIAILNIAGPQRLSRYEFGLKTVRAFGVEPSFEPALSASHPSPRPRDCALDVSLAQQILKTRLRSVDEVTHEWKRINE